MNLKIFTKTIYGDDTEMKNRMKKKRCRVSKLC